MLMVLFSDLTIGEMLAVFAYLWFMMTPVQEILGIQYAYHGARAALGRINADRPIGATQRTLDRRAAERPDMNGDDVMAYLGLEPGPAVGEAVRMLLELKRSEGKLSRPELEARLDAWWAERSTVS